MPVHLSPGVLVVEKDLTNAIPAAASSIGAYVGNFAWGPASQPVTIGSELDLIKFFGKPNQNTYLSFFSAANFLAYSGNLVVVRQLGSAARNATADKSGLQIANEDVWEDQYFDGSANVGLFAAKYAGDLGNSLKVSMADSFSHTRTLTGSISTNTSGPNLTEELTGTGTDFVNEVAVGDTIINSSGIIVGTVNDIVDAETMNLTAPATVALSGATNVVAEWEFADEFSFVPGTSDTVELVGGQNDEVHVIVVDEDGIITGTPGTVLESYAGLSKALDAKTTQGANNYLRDALKNSQYAYWMDNPSSELNVSGSNWGVAAQNTNFKTLKLPVTESLGGGVSETSLSSGEVRAGYDKLVNDEQITVNLIITGAHDLADAKYVIENIAEVRKDCVVFTSPSLVSVLNNPGEEAADIVAERVDASFNANSSYGVMDGNWKSQYDKYNDVYRWLPCNPDTAGLCARTDLTNDPWWSPAGLNRGQIKNVRKLAWYPNKAERDLLAANSVNAIVSTPGEGTYLFNDMTLLSKPSAFDQIGVRRLFIALETAIKRAAKYQLFEFNDAFTRAQFRNMVEPFLRDVQGRRGIKEFFVVCDKTNNTDEVVMRKEFVGDIYVKPNYAIRGITLNFIATRDDVSFTEITGQ